MIPLFQWFALQLTNKYCLSKILKSSLDIKYNLLIKNNQYFILRFEHNGPKLSRFINNFALNCYKNWLLIKY